MGSRLPVQTAEMRNRDSNHSFIQRTRVRLMYTRFYCPLNCWMSAQVPRFNWLAALLRTAFNCQLATLWLSATRRSYRCTDANPTKNWRPSDLQPINACTWCIPQRGRTEKPSTKNLKNSTKNEDKGHNMREYSEHESKVAEGMDGGWQNQLEHDSMVKLYKNSIVTPSYHDTQFATQLTML